MASVKILHARLLNQQIAAHKFESPDEVVKWFGAVQAQDYLGALWAIGLRINNATESDIEKAIANKTILRTWPMRGTLHFIAPEDARWMLQLLTPRIISRAAAIYRNSGLDKKVFAKSSRVIVKALQGGKQFERQEIYRILEEAKISTSGNRGLHILGMLAQQGLICFGPRKGKQQSFVLLDEWVPETKSLKGDEATATLAQTYFTSHGPATVQDFVWWSGLTVADAKRGLDIIKKKFTEIRLNDNSYWMRDNALLSVEKLKGIFLLPCFDEYLVGYKDRSAAVTAQFTQQMFGASNGIFASVLLINGKVEGTWKRSFYKNEVIIEIKPFKKLMQTEKAEILKVAKQYSNFTAMNLKLHY